MIDGVIMSVGHCTCCCKETDIFYSLISSLRIFTLIDERDRRNGKHMHTQSLFIDTSGGDGQGYICAKGLTGNSNPPVCWSGCTFEPPGCTSGECAEHCIQGNCAGVIANNQCYTLPYSTGSEAALIADEEVTFPSASACCVPP